MILHENMSLKENVKLKQVYLSLSLFSIVVSMIFSLSIQTNVMDTSIFILLVWKNDGDIFSNYMKISLNKNMMSFLKNFFCRFRLVPIKTQVLFVGFYVLKLVVCNHILFFKYSGYIKEL